MTDDWRGRRWGAAPACSARSACSGVSAVGSSSVAPRGSTARSAHCTSGGEFPGRSSTCLLLLSTFSSVRECGIQVMPVVGTTTGSPFGSVRRAGALRLRNSGARDAEQACEGAPARRGNGPTVRDYAPGLPGDDGRGEARPVIEREVRQRLDLLSVGCRASIRPDVEAKHIAPRGSICQDPDDWLESSTTNVAPSPGSDWSRSRPPILRVSSREM